MKSFRPTPSHETRRARLLGKDISYVLVRRKRSSIGLKIDERGLTVSVPLRASRKWLEQVLTEKADWIVKKLDEWRGKRNTHLVWAEGALFPLLNRQYRVLAGRPGVFSMVEARNGQLDLPLAFNGDGKAIEAFVMAWYRRHALACFVERVRFYAARLGIDPPPVRLSNARTQWGNCSAAGGIRLNWRLIQMPLNLVDYVVAHELAHLIEMNHSPAFWKVVARIYPDYQAARAELRNLV